MADRVSVLSLRCRACGESLAGLASDLVFSCRRCRVAADVESGEIVWLPYEAARPLRECPNPMFLPFWEFSVDYAANTDDARKESAYARAKQLSALYVMGFSGMRISLVGDVGQQLTGRQVRFETASDGYILGATKGAHGARAYLKPFVLSFLDRIADVTGVDLQLQVKSVRLLAWPFNDEGDHLIDALTGIKIPAMSVVDLDAIRKAAPDCG